MYIIESQVNPILSTTSIKKENNKNSNENDNNFVSSNLYQRLLLKSKKNTIQNKEKGASLINIVCPKGKSQSLILSVFEICFLNSCR